MRWTVRLMYDHLYVLKMRATLYSIWSIHEIYLIILGLGYDEERKEWDDLRSFDVNILETTSDMQQKVALWNIGTHKWLKQYTYKPCMALTSGDRLVSTLATSLVSSAWHGARPGVFSTSITIQLLVASTQSKFIYHNLNALDMSLYMSWPWPLNPKGVNCALNQLTVNYLFNYAMIPYTLSSFREVWDFWKIHRFSGHVFFMVALVIIPFFRRMRRSWK